MNPKFPQIYLFIQKIPIIIIPVNYLIENFKQFQHLKLQILRIYLLHHQLHSSDINKFLFLTLKYKSYTHLEVSSFSYKLFLRWIKFIKKKKVREIQLTLHLKYFVLISIFNSEYNEWNENKRPRKNEGREEKSSKKKQ